MAISDLARWGVSAARGFLPETDPLPRLPSRFDPWEGLAQNLPKVLVSDRVRPTLEGVPPFDVSALAGERELRRAMLLLSYLGHAYVWGGETPARQLPANLAMPWHAVAARLGRPPVLSYASYALDNWRRLDPEREVELGNIALIQNFMGGVDEEWFILVHVDIERRAAPAVTALRALQEAAAREDERELARRLSTIEMALASMYATMERMPERCDPYVYYHRVRPYIHGWKNHPDLPEGLVYQGVEAYGGAPQQFRGETGAQSGIVPALDAALGIGHGEDLLKTYLLEMRDYMPPEHRSFVVALERGPTVREYVSSRAGRETRGLYDACVGWVERFRSLHLKYAADYIHKQAQTDAKNPSEVGTGGTPFMRYLKKHRDETAAHTLG